MFKLLNTNTLEAKLFQIQILVDLNIQKYLIPCLVVLSSSCHQTSVFHLSTHFFAVSLNLLRSSNEQGCARRVHCIMCAVFSVARPHSQVVSPS